MIKREAEDGEELKIMVLFDPSTGSGRTGLLLSYPHPSSSPSQGRGNANRNGKIFPHPPLRKEGIERLKVKEEVPYILKTVSFRGPYNLNILICLMGKTRSRIEFRMTD
ncbi:MAG: hypothetical protein ACHQ6U_03995 [Thermodesulfobacteriota bacterium]